MESELTVTKVIENAITALETSGWCQHRTKNEAGQRCLLGALGSSWDWIALEWGDIAKKRALDLYDGAKERLRAFVGPHVSTWNDVEGRTVEEVIEVLKKAKTVEV